MRLNRESDFEIDYATVMGSRERSWAKYGQAWGWPLAPTTWEEDRLVGQVVR